METAAPTRSGSVPPATMTAAVTGAAGAATGGTIAEPPPKLKVRWLPILLGLVAGAVAFFALSLKWWLALVIAFVVFVAAWKLTAPKAA
jgi:hypothetical protein